MNSFTIKGQVKTIHHFITVKLYVSVSNINVPKKIISVWKLVDILLIKNLFDVLLHGKQRVKYKISWSRKVV